jgi:hypothetical protein
MSKHDQEIYDARMFLQEETAGSWERAFITESHLNHLTFTQQKQEFLNVDHIQIADSATRPAVANQR